MHARTSGEPLPSEGPEMILLAAAPREDGYPPELVSTPH